MDTKCGPIQSGGHVCWYELSDGIARIGTKYFANDKVGFALDAGLGSSYVAAAFIIRVH